MTISIDNNSIKDVIINGTNVKNVTLNGTVVFTRVDAPTITTQPAGATIKDNQTHTFRVVATTGDGVLSYQWYRNGAVLSGATGSSYTTPTQGVGSYKYKCLVKNERGQVWTSEVTLTVQASYTATHNMTPDIYKVNSTVVGYGYIPSFPWYGNGQMSPTDFHGININSFGDVHLYALPEVVFSLAGNHSGKRIKISWNNGANSETSAAGTYSNSQTNFKFVLNGAVHKYYKSHLKVSKPYKFEWA